MEQLWCLELTVGRSLQVVSPTCLAAGVMAGIKGEIAGGGGPAPRM